MKSVDKNKKFLFSSKITRRQFLSGAGAFLAALALDNNPAKHLSLKNTFKNKNVVIVIFGAGVRNSETISDPQHIYIPNLWNKLKPQGALYTNLYNMGKLVHVTAMVSIITGNWAWRNWGKGIDWKKDAFINPTIFEYFRKAHNLSIEETGIFNYIDIYDRIFASNHNEYGLNYGVPMFTPPEINKDVWEQLDLSLSSIYQEPNIKKRMELFEEIERSFRRDVSCIDYNPCTGYPKIDKFSKDFFVNWIKDSNKSYSHDEYTYDCAIEAMKLFYPKLILLYFGETDIAHEGKWSGYVNAIKKTDVLTFRLWEAIQNDVHYRDKTTMLIVPDHGRHAGNLGFMEHGDIYDDTGIDEECRQGWLLALGPDILRNKIISKRKEHIDIASTVGLLLDFDTLYAQGSPMTEMLKHESSAYFFKV